MSAKLVVCEVSVYNRSADMLMILELYLHYVYTSEHENIYLMFNNMDVIEIQQMGGGNVT